MAENMPCSKGIFVISIGWIFIEDYMEFSKKLLASFLLLNLTTVDLQYYISFRGTEKNFNCVYIYIHIHFFRFFPITGYYDLLNRVPCAIQ